MRDEAAVKALLEAHGLPYFPGITPLPTRVTGKGVDVANSEHGDRAAIADFYGTACPSFEAFQCPDSNQLGARIVGEARRHAMNPHRVAVDAIGVGAGTVNEARRLGFSVTAMYAGGLPMNMIEKAEDGQVVEWAPDVNMFKNLRGQMYWQIREDLRQDRIDLEENRDLWQELMAHTFADEGKVMVLSPKDDVKLKIGRSPDSCDAVVMANFTRERAVIPKTPILEQGRTAGFDFQSRRPKEKPSPEQELALIFERAQPNLISSRYSVPRRRGR